MTKKDLKQLVARARRVTPPGSPSRAKAAIVPPEAGVTNVGAPGADAVNVETVLSSTGEACTVEPEHAPSSLKGSPEGARAISVTIEGVLEHGGLGLGLDSDNLISEVEPSSVCHPPPEPRMNTFAPSPPRPSHPHARLRSRVQPASAKDVRLGDRLLSIDGHSLAGRRIRDVFAEDIAAGQWPAARHELVLQRGAAATAAASAEAPPGSLRVAPCVDILNVGAEEEKHTSAEALEGLFVHLVQEEHHVLEAAARTIQKIYRGKIARRQMHARLHAREHEVEEAIEEVLNGWCKYYGPCNGYLLFELQL